MQKRGTIENPFRILLVEDNPGDADLMKEAFSRSELIYEVEVVVDGEEAIRRLEHQSSAGQTDSPDLLILDLNLPRMDGREVLRIVKNHPVFKILPVVVFSSSSAEKDLADVYRLHANCFITKPVELSNYLDIAKQIQKFWFGAARIPMRTAF